MLVSELKEELSGWAENKDLPVYFQYRGQLQPVVLVKRGRRELPDKMSKKSVQPIIVLSAGI